jgi:hypothetical protein
MKPVVKLWVFELPFRMQSVLFASLRGCDTAHKDDFSKYITRSLRGVVLHNADTSNSFIDSKPPTPEVTKEFLYDMDSYPMHWIAHTMHAAEIIGYKHPDVPTSTWWLQFYQAMVKGLHLQTETPAQLDVRLGFTPGEGAHPDMVWEAGTGTSHKKTNYV